VAEEKFLTTLRRPHHCRLGIEHRTLRKNHSEDGKALATGRAKRYNSEPMIRKPILYLTVPFRDYFGLSDST
jgi:hypothetical protein